MTGSAVTDLAVRPFAPADEAAVLDLLQTALGGGPVGHRPASFFRWKHLHSPFGPSYMLLAEADGRVVGLRAFLRWRFRAGQTSLSAVRAVDTATHPDHRGRGIFSRLTLRALDDLRGEVDLVFNTPNGSSLPGYLKMGWTPVGAVPVAIRVRRPVRFVRGIRGGDQEDAGATGAGRGGPAGEASAPGGADPLGPPVDADPAAEGLPEEQVLARLLESAAPREPRIVTATTASFLRWRYADAPLLGYRVIRAEAGGELRGLAVFRVRRRGGLWESTIADVIVARDDVRTARRLLRRVIHAAPVDHLTCRFAPGSAAGRAARQVGFLPSRRGITFVTNPLRAGIRPDPADLRSWAICLGDLEVF